VFACHALPDGLDVLGAEFKLADSEATNLSVALVFAMPLTTSLTFASVSLSACSTVFNGLVRLSFNPS
jgi:hypothetical protein